jgi:hypothetical protein
MSGNPIGTRTKLPTLSVLVLLAATCSEPDPDAGRAARPPVQAPVATPTTPFTLPPLVAAHYFGRQWPKNFIGGFRRGDVREDFARISGDGFNAVVLLVSWGDFQPVFAPCCRYDERAFERLHFLLDEADRAKLKVVLRVGYAWSFHPDAGNALIRADRLMNDPAARVAYQQFVARLGHELADRPGVALTFMSWEDQWLHRIDPRAKADYREFRTARPSVPTSFWGSFWGLPAPQGRDGEAFNAYWDWLVVEKLFRPALTALPNLSYEARIDHDAIRFVEEAGRTKADAWVRHAGMAALPPGRPLTIYWAPFWGARNEGEQLGADQSLHLLTVLLEEVAQNSGGRALFIDQFNVVDNTPGYERFAVLRRDEIPRFLSRAVCVMRANHVQGYGFWTTVDYRESPIYNPAFGYGLDGWSLQRASGDARAALEALPDGDFQLRLGAHDQLSQEIPAERGRLPKEGALPSKICIEAMVRKAARLSVRAGDGPAVALEFPATGRRQVCAAIAPRPTADRLDLRIVAERGDVALRSVQLFDHVEYGGLYDADRRPGPLLPMVRRMNRDFLAEPAPARCTKEPE